MTSPGTYPDASASNSPSGSESSSPEEIRTDATPEQPERFLVVGLGASAGGLRAFERFFRSMQPDSGMAFIVVQHLPPDRKSDVPRIIQQHTSMSVCEVEDGARIEPDCVYIIPPSRQLTIKEGRLRLAEPVSNRGHSAPIDLCLRSLAEDQREYAACVILSGLGTDGTAGLRAVKEYGGITLVQAPEDAEFEGMPASAIATGLVDVVLPVEQLASRLVELAEGMEPSEVDPTSLPDDDSTALQGIFAHLRSQTGHDFTHYKRSTVLRRLERRMLVHQVERLSDYLAVLLARREETGALLKSLLINVTYFFRDREAFRALEHQVIPRLYQERSSESGLRVWVPGCSTGEEAYTIAMLLVEYAERHGQPADFQIFATDIDPETIDFARNGLYSEAIAADVTGAQLERFFAWEGEGYRVRKEIREKVLFALHSLIKDPPFSRLDFISCRNVLIYLDREVQDQVFDLFHYALRPGGYLFLGMSESADRAGGQFITLDKKCHIFQRSAITRRMPRLSTPSVVRIDHAGTATARKAAERRPLNVADLHARLLLERYAPPSVIVGDHNDIVHVAGNAARYLQISEGDPTQNVLRLIRKELRIELRTGLHQARRQGEPVRTGVVPLDVSGELRQVSLYITPVSDPEVAPGLVQVTFEDFPGLSDSAPAERVSSTDSTHLAEQLEDELLRTKASLQATIEDLERSNEELKASNEELLSTNEELQSTAEELETSQEELQSMNEELITVNHELKEKVEEVSRSNSDLQNLIVSTDIGTIFLDRELRIKRYTPRATDLFNIVSSDVGRPLAHFTHRIDYDNLLELASRVLTRLLPVEREIRSNDGRWYLVRILPYRTVEDKIDGVVITFVDMTDRRRAETILSRQQQQLRALIENAPDIIARFDRDFRHVYINPAIEKFTGMARQNFLGKTNRELDFPPDLVSRWEEVVGQVFETGQESSFEFDISTPQGTVSLHSRLVPELGPDGTVDTVLSIARDVTDRRRVEDALRDSERRFRLMADAAPVMIWVAGPDKKCYYFNRSWLDFTGRTIEEEQNDGWAEGVHPDDVDRCLRTYVNAFDAHEAFTMEYRLRRRDGLYRWVIDNGVPQYAPDGTFAGYIGSCLEIHDRKEVEGRLRQRALQQAAVAELGLRAMDRITLPEFMETVARRVAETLEADYCNVFELRPDGRSFVLHAGMGWASGSVGTATIEAEGTMAGYALQAGAPVVVRDFASETRFKPSELLREHGVVSGMSVIIGSTSGPYGVLGVHNTERRDFSQDDQNFLQSVANLLGDAVDRARAQEALEQANRELDARVAERTAELQERVAELETAQEALRRSEEQTRHLFESAPDAIFVESLEGVVLDVNPGACRLHGVDREDLIGKHFRDLIPPEQVEEATAHFQRVVSGEATHLVGYSLRKDGTAVPVEVRASHFTYESQPALLLHVTDISERRRAEELLGRERELSELLINGSFDGILAFDRELRYTVWNPAMERISGVPKEQAVGRHAFEVFPFLKEIGEDVHFYAALEGRHSTSEDRRFVIPETGREGYFEAHYSPLRQEHGDIVGGIGVVRDVTQRKKSEEALHHSEERWRLLVEQNPDPIVLTIEGRIEYMNVAGLEIFGASSLNELKGRSVFEFVPPSVHAVGRERLEKIRHGQATTPIESRIIRLDGSELDVETFSIPITYDGKPAAQTVVRDITGRRQEREALRQSEERWRTLVEHNPDPIVISSDGVILYANPAGVRLVKANSLEDLVERSIFDFAQPGKHELGPERLRLIKSGRATEPMETTIVRLDGTEVEVETFSTPIVYEGKRAAQTVIRDVSARKKAEEIVRRSEERFARAFRAAPVAMIITRLGSGRVVDVNDSFARLSGFTREEVIGRKASEVGLSIHRILRDRVGNILEEGVGYEDVEAEVDTKPGGVRHVLSSGEVIEFGGETCLLSMFYDITERKRLEQEVLEIAEEERRRIGQDLHDGLGQQLTGIAFLSKLLEQNLRSASPEHGGQMHRIVELLSQAISYTRNLSRVLSPVDVPAEGLHDALRRLADSTRDYFDVGCRFQAAENVRVASNSVATHLYRVAQEAVNNALKHSEAKEVVIELVRTDGQGVLRVRDNGHGIPEEERKRAGGMGMRTMQYRTNVIGGKFEIYPAEDGGTVVEVRFPLTMGREAQD